MPAVLAVSLTLPAVASGDTFRARNKMRVAERDAVLIEVGGFTGNAGLEDYWCAVGEYLHRVKKTPWRQKVYVVRGLGPGEITTSRDAVLFTLDPEAAGVAPLDKQLRIVGTLTVGRAKTVTSAFYSCERFPTL